VRKNFVIYVIILCACLVTGISALFYGHKAEYLKQANDWTFRLGSSSLQHPDHILLDDYESLAPIRNTLAEAKTNQNQPPNF